MVKKKVDCPETLVQLANTKFERAVVVEFISMDKKLDKTFDRLKWLERLTTTVLIVILINIVVRLI
jgi:hypothetical protein